MQHLLSGYGIEQLATLRAVMLHRPDQALKLINSTNYQYHLFDQVPNIDGYLEEHDQYAKLLQQLGIQVFYLNDQVVENYNLVKTLPNLTYLHDIAVVTRQGFILSQMSAGTRYGEEQVVKEALLNLGIPAFIEFESFDQFEGCLLLSPDILVVADTERHHPASIEKFIPQALELVKEVIWLDIPQSRRFMHPDMVLGRIREDLLLVFLPAIQRVRVLTRNGIRQVDDFTVYMQKKGIELVEVSSEEQQKWATSFVAIKPGVIAHYDIALRPETQKHLSQRGVEIINFHPRALLAGGGSLRCLTLRLWRQEI
ncbi:MAG: dimethylarginine dimethylaminohydrolase family protein [Methylocystaceae bacterium]